MQLKVDCKNWQYKVLMWALEPQLSSLFGNMEKYELQIENEQPNYSWKRSTKCL